MLSNLPRIRQHNSTPISSHLPNHYLILINHSITSTLARDRRLLLYRHDRDTVDGMSVPLGPEHVLTHLLMHIGLVLVALLFGFVLNGVLGCLGAGRDVVVPVFCYGLMGSMISWLIVVPGVMKG